MPRSQFVSAVRCPRRSGHVVLPTPEPSKQKRYVRKLAKQKLMRFFLSDQIYYLPLSGCIGPNVALGSAQRLMTSKHLHVP